MKMYLVLSGGALVSLILLMMSFICMNNGSGVMMYWSFIDFLGVDFSFILFFDWVSMLFMTVVIFITFFVLIYSVEYMEGMKFITLYMYLIVLFVISMSLVILSPSLMSILLGWDGLGLISYCLVSYYQSLYSYKASFLTLLMNRVGDLTLIMSICLMWGSGWNFYLFLKGENMFLIFMLTITGFAKSAQFPLSIWLPAAMAAPTPISSLVHSSTLVTAGVYLFLRFSSVYLGGGGLFNFFALLTSGVASVIALFIHDLKKIIAMSTLSQLGLMMFFYSWGMLEMVYFHLLMHALFKSVMFMCAGVIIHFTGDSQDIRCMGGLGGNFLPFTICSFILSSLSLSGVPFLAGFCSKDFMLELMMMGDGNMFMFFFMLLLVSMTGMYSFRIIFYLIFFNKSTTYYNKGSESLMGSMLMSLTVMSIISGTLFLDLIFINFGVMLENWLFWGLIFMLSAGMLGSFYFCKKSFYFFFFNVNFIMTLMGMNLLMSSLNFVSLSVTSGVLFKCDKGWLEVMIFIWFKLIFSEVIFFISGYSGYFYLLLIISMSVLIMFLMDGYWNY